ncbi:MAG TPA: hypothetical protein VN611_04530 [Patescibacteria group bacterium]|nr:hypothetical protein [Patescibacteria group bacterium]
MKKVISFAIILLFCSTLVVLGLHIFGVNSQKKSFDVSETRQTKTGVYAKVLETVLGQTEVYNYQRMGFNKGFIRFSPDCRCLAVGSETGDVLLYTTEGQLIWKKNMGLGKLTALEFAPDSQTVLVGETSQQGCLLSLRVKDGSELWRQASDHNLGVNIKEKTYPGFVAIRTDAQGFIYAVAQRYVKQADKASEYFSRIYKFAPNGERLGQFPVDSNMDGWVNWLDVDKAGSKVAFCTGNFDPGSYQYNQLIYCIDGNVQQLLWSNTAECTPPYQTVTMRTSPDLTPDGKYAAGITSDGRCFLYAGDDGRELWRRSISKPQKIGGVYLNAAGSFAYIIENYAVFTTGNTFNKANWQLPTPVEQPNSNSVFIFDLSGTLVNSYKLGGMVEQMAVGPKMAALAIGRNVRAKDPAVHGFYILTIPEAELVDCAQTEGGPAVAVDISADGRYVAGIEAPLQLDDGSVIGAYKLTLLVRR